MVKDCQRFVMRFFEPISESAASIYSSALPFTPKCHLYEIYRYELYRSVIVQHGRETGWDPCLRVQQAGSSVDSVAFSPTGDRLASGLHNSTIRIWDSRNVAEIATLKCHTTSVVSVAFSPDGDRLASGSSPLGCSDVCANREARRSHHRCYFRRFRAHWCSPCVRVVGQHCTGVGWTC